MGKVISNDYVSFASNISNAIISNNKTKLNKKDLELLMKKPKNMTNLFSLNLTIFSKEDNDFIDIIRHNAQKLTKIKKSLP